MNHFKKTQVKSILIVLISLAVGLTIIGCGSSDDHDISDCTGPDCKIDDPIDNTSGDASDDASNTVECGDGYYVDGNNCVDVDECANGAADCDPLVSCKNTTGSFECGKCPPGHVDTNGNGTLCSEVEFAEAMNRMAAEAFEFYQDSEVPDYGSNSGSMPRCIGNCAWSEGIGMFKNSWGGNVWRP